MLFCPPLYCSSVNAELLAQDICVDIFVISDLNDVNHAEFLPDCFLLLVYRRNCVNNNSILRESSRLLCIVQSMTLSVFFYTNIRHSVCRCSAGGPRGVTLAAGWQSAGSFLADKIGISSNNSKTLGDSGRFPPLNSFSQPERICPLSSTPFFCFLL